MYFIVEVVDGLGVPGFVISLLAGGCLLYRGVMAGGCRVLLNFFPFLERTWGGGM